MDDCVIKNIQRMTSKEDKTSLTIGSGSRRRVP